MNLIVERAVERNAVLVLALQRPKASFTLMLRDSDRRCDQVMQTPFTGTLLSVNPWEARLLR
jgi:hypothetical protein